MCETLQFLDIMCGSTTGGLGLLGLYINEYNVALITQTLETLTEYCQGPCHENQVCGHRRGVSGAPHPLSGTPERGIGVGGKTVGSGSRTWDGGDAGVRRSAVGYVLG